MPVFVSASIGVIDLFRAFRMWQRSRSHSFFRHSHSNLQQLSHHPEIALVLLFSLSLHRISEGAGF